MTSSPPALSSLTINDADVGGDAETDTASTDSPPNKAELNRNLSTTSTSTTSSSTSNTDTVSSTASIPAAPIRAVPWGTTAVPRSIQQPAPLRPPSAPGHRARDLSVSSTATITPPLPPHLTAPTPPASPSRQRPMMNGPATRATLGAGIRSASTISVRSSARGLIKCRDDFEWGDVIGEGSYSTVTLAWDKPHPPSPTTPTLSASTPRASASPSPSPASSSSLAPSSIPSAPSSATSASSATSSTSSPRSSPPPPSVRPRRVYAMKELSQHHIVKENKVKYVTIEKNALQLLNSPCGGTPGPSGPGRPRSRTRSPVAEPTTPTMNGSGRGKSWRTKRERHEGHDGIIKLWFTFREGDSLFFALEYAPKGELLSHIKMMGSFDEISAKYYAAQIISAIGYMHDRGVIHRDVKPENILFDDHMHVKVTDFGSARIGEQAAASGDSPDGYDWGDADRSNSFVGTAEYVSPELLRDRAAGKACDFWAFGCIIFQMLAGRPPFKAPNEYLTFQTIMRLEYKFPDNFPSVARDLVEKLLVLEPSDRLGSGSGGIEAIRNHPWFDSIDFTTIWTLPAPEIRSGLVPPPPPPVQARPSFADFGWDSDEDDGLDGSSDLGPSPVEQEPLSPTSVSQAAGSDSDSPGPTPGDVEEPKRSFFGWKSAASSPTHTMTGERWSALLLNTETLALTSPVQLRVQGPLFLTTKRRWLLLTDLPRLVCVKEENMKIKFEIDLGVGDAAERARVWLVADNKLAMLAGDKELEFTFKQDSGIARRWLAEIQQYLEAPRRGHSGTTTLVNSAPPRTSS